MIVGTGHTHTDNSESPDKSGFDTTLPLAQLLNADGSFSLRLGVSANRSATGCEMASDVTGSPRFVPAGGVDAAAAAAPSMADSPDDNWAREFAPPGVSSTVYALAVRARSLDCTREEGRS